MLSEQSLTDTYQQKATEKPNQDGRQEIKAKKTNKAWRRIRNTDASKQMETEVIFAQVWIFL